MANVKLSDAKKARKDEFYTQYFDIEREVNAYLDYDPNVFVAKRFYCPAMTPNGATLPNTLLKNFERFGLKKLISTSYAVESKNYEFSVSTDFLKAVTQDLI